MKRQLELAGIITFIITTILLITILILSFIEKRSYNIIRSELHELMKNKSENFFKWHDSLSDFRLEKFNTNNTPIFGAEYKIENKIMFTYYCNAESLFKDAYIKESAQQVDAPEPASPAR